MNSPPAGRRLWIRRAQRTDVDAVLQLAAETPQAAQWSKDAYAASLVDADPESAAHKALFIASSPEQPVIGFVALTSVAVSGRTECEVENLAVASAWRRQGAGQRLLTAGMLWCRTWRSLPYSTANNSSLSIWLEVRASNHAAISFYQRMGFSCTGTRPGYYCEPVDDAVLMQKLLPENKSC